MNWGRKDGGTPWLLSGSHVSWRPLVRTHRGVIRYSWRLHAWDASLDFGMFLI